MSTQTLVIQIIFATIVIGGIYNLFKTTRAYGGLIGSGLKWIGIGILFFSLEAIDRALGSYSVITSFNVQNPELVHNVILILGLLFSAIGFSKLTKITKQ